LGLIGVTLLAAEVYLVRVLEAQMLADIRADLSVRARLVAERIAASPGTMDDFRALDALADRLGEVVGGRVTIVARNGRVVGDSAVAVEALSRVDDHGSRPEIAQALAAQEGFGVRSSQTVHERLMYIAVPVMRDGAV